MRIYQAGLFWAVLALSAAAAPPPLQISEFMAVNQKTVKDVDGDFSPWIEIYNPTTSDINLSGWALTDDTNNLTQWRFPNVAILDAADANEDDNFMVVFASGKNRTNNAAELHTNFRLPTGGGYLALVDPNTNIVSVFENYPAQQADVSYGRDASDPNFVGYFSEPTPEDPNSMSSALSSPAVTFSQTSRTFALPFTLNLSTDPGSVIYYTIDGSVPTRNSLLYQTGISISGSVQVRARAFAPGLMPGDIHSETFLLLDNSLQSIGSDLPAIVIYNYAGGSVQEAVSQVANISIYEPQNGVTSLTNAPTFTGRAGIHLHGSSTLTSPKQSYAINFWDDLNNNLDRTPLGFPAESDFILYGPDIFEPVLMHNPLMYQLSNDLGRYASRTRFVEVYINTSGGPVTAANYNGIYVLEEKIKWGPDRVNIPKQHSVDALHPLDNSNPNVTGGYIMKVDRLDAGETGFTADGQVIAYDYPNEQDIKTPQRAPQQQYLQNYMNSFASAVNGTNFMDPVLGYRQFIDTSSCLDYHILNAVALNVDVLALSTYFYKDRNDILHYGPIWDFDRSQGSKNGVDFNPTVWSQPSTDIFRKYWWNRMFNDINFWQAWIDRYEDLRLTTLSTNHVFATIDSFAAQVQKEEPREVGRWSSLTAPRSGNISINGYTYNFSGTYAGEVSFLKQWYSDRLHFIDSNFLAKPLFTVNDGAILAGGSLGMSAQPNATIYYTTDGSDPRLAGGGISSNALIYTSSIVLTTNITIKARAYNAAHFNALGASNPVLSSPWSGLASESFSIASVPVITQAPQNMDAYVGQSPAFTITATGSPAPAYQWSFNGAVLTGETNSQLTLTLTQTNQTGTYTVNVTNVVGGTNASFFLTVTPKPHLVVTEVMASESKGTSLTTEDWWELTNLGNFPVNLQGYRFDDDHDSFADAQTISSAVTIAPGESIILVEDMEPEDFRAWWGVENLPVNLQIIPYPSIGFSSDGDSINLWNAAATSVTDTVASVTFPAATKGISFGYDPVSGTLGKLSVAGQNGAFVAALNNGDIGSPGKVIVVPVFARTSYRGSGFNMRFSTLPNLSYVIEYKNTLADAEWITLTNFVATTNTFFLRDFTTGTNASRFYRLGVAP